jgi:predicted ferric reductase
MTTTTNSLHTNRPFARLLTLLLSLVLVIAGAGLVLGAAWLVAAHTALLGQLGDALGITNKTPWYLSRSAGTVAYLLLAGSTIWGLLLSTKIIKESVPAALALAMHNALSWLAIAFTGVHALALLFDDYFTYTLTDLAVPFAGPYRPGWVGLGIIGLYLMLLTSISFSFRKQIGQKRWRQLHYLTFAVYVLVTVHGVMAGTDSGNPGVRAIYVFSGLLVLFLTNYRLLGGNGVKVRGN